MALEEQTIVDQINTLEDGCINVRTATVILKDDVEISRTFHRHVVTPISNISGENARVQAVANAVHTSEVKAAYRTAHGL